MEYLIGSVSTLVVIVIMRRVLEKSLPKKIPVVNRPSQSSIYSIVQPFIPLFQVALPPKKTQATVHNDKNKINVLLVEDNAYWITDNTFYVADIIDGVVDQESTKVVDIMGMDAVELDKMSFIVSKLTEGSEHDSWGSRDS
jgi:hypothetical protein